MPYILAMSFTRLLALPERGSSLLLGPRQTGKSTLVRGSLPAGSPTFDLLEHDTFLRLARDPSQFRREVIAVAKAGAKVVFVDEVQRVPALLDEVHGLIEKRVARFVLTGSSARKLRRGGANLLAGRARMQRLHPLVLRELGDDFDLERVLRFGTLPAVVSSDEEDAVELLRAYAETYLREEIQAEALVRNLGGFARFLDIAAAQSGDILNYSAVGRDAGLPVRTVQEYFQILEDTLVGYRLEPWRRSARARLTGHPRFYLFDTGVRNALVRRLGAEVDPQVRGRLFEHLIVLECARALDYARSEARLYFWRTNHGAEVDLLVERHDTLRLAIEIKSTRTISGADLSGLRSFAEENAGVPRIVVCDSPREHALGDVRIVPWRSFLTNIDEWLGS